MFIVGFFFFMGTAYFLLQYSIWNYNNNLPISQSSDQYKTA